MLDWTAMIFYAAICGGLAVFAPSSGTWPMRAGIGIIVGLGAAVLLPLFKGMIGY
ncbi:MAG: hypothetical protein AAGH82_09675 [Pseudomonadota bacterium]